MVVLKLPNCWFPQKPIWLQDTGAAAASAARGFHWIKVTRSLAGMATLPSKGPCSKIRATLLPFSAASGRRNDCTRQAYASRARIKFDNWASALIEHDVIAFAAATWIPGITLDHIISYHMSFRCSHESISFPISNGSSNAFPSVSVAKAALSQHLI